MFGDDVPDPLALSTFEAAILDWPDQGQRLPRHVLVKRLLRTRRDELMPHLGSAKFDSADLHQDDRLLIACWTLGNDVQLHLRANISDHNVTNDTSPMPGRPIWGGELPVRLRAWSVFWSLKRPEEKRNSA